MAIKYNPFTGNLDIADTVNGVASGGSSTDNAIPRWDGTDGSTLQDSGVTINDNDRLTIPVGGLAGLSFGDGDTGLIEPLDDTLRFQTDSIAAIDIDSSQIVTLTNALPVGSGGTGQTTYTDGQLLIGNTTGNTLAKSTLTAGTNLDVTNGSGSITVGVTSDFDMTGMHGWNGAILETAAVSAASDGATITFSVEQSGGGDLTVVFSDGYYTWDTTPADTVTLTAGSDTSPTLNYVYFLQSTKTLTVSTVGWPATEHAPLATVLCQSAASLQTDGPYKFHAWTDHVVATDIQGHIADLNFWIRQQPATWDSGVAQTYTITPNGGAADNVILTTAAGVVLQLHTHTFPAFSGTPDIYVVNDSVTPYTKVTDLNALLTDSTGASMSGKYFSLVIWGVVSEDTGDCKLMCNLPGGSYNNATSLTADTSKFANFDIPGDFVGTGFLISQWNLRHQAASGGTWTSISEIDLRGLLPAIGAGGSNAFPTEFEDNTFRILDDGDNTKEIAFEASGITTATTRTFTMPDASGTVALASGLAANGMAYALDGNTVDSTAAATNGQLLIGSTGVAPVLGTITGGTGLTTTNGGGTIQLDLDGEVAVWAEETTTSRAVVVNEGVIGNNAATITATLPSTAALGSIFEFVQKGAGLLKIGQNAGQTVHFGGSDTTTGVGGSLTSTAQWDAIKLVCTTANTDFAVLSSLGSWTIV